MFFKCGSLDKDSFFMIHFCMNFYIMTFFHLLLCLQLFRSSDSNFEFQKKKLYKTF